MKQSSQVGLPIPQTRSLPELCLASPPPHSHAPLKLLLPVHEPFPVLSPTFCCSIRYFTVLVSVVPLCYSYYTVNTLPTQAVIPFLISWCHVNTSKYCTLYVLYYRISLNWLLLYWLKGEPIFSITGLVHAFVHKVGVRTACPNGGHWDRTSEEEGMWKVGWPALPLIEMRGANRGQGGWGGGAMGSCWLTLPPRSGLGGGWGPGQPGRGRESLGRGTD